MPPNLFNKTYRVAQRQRIRDIKTSLEHRAWYDLALEMQIIRLPGIKKEFDSIVFMGSNPHFFLMKYKSSFNKLYICDSNEDSL